jgi:hypothetical protein
LVIAGVVGLVVARRRAKARRIGPHLSTVFDDAAHQVWTFDVRELRATVRPPAPPGARAFGHYELRRSATGLWEMRKSAPEPPDLPILFPTHGLRPPRETLDDVGESQSLERGPYRRSARSAWTACSDEAQAEIERAHQRYTNG